MHYVRHGRYARPFDARVLPLDGPEAATKRGELASVIFSPDGEGSPRLHNATRRSASRSQPLVTPAFK